MDGICRRGTGLPGPGVSVGGTGGASRAAECDVEERRRRSLACRDVPATEPSPVGPADGRAGPAARGVPTAARSGFSDAARDLSARPPSAHGVGTPARVRRRRFLGFGIGARPAKAPAGSSVPPVATCSRSALRSGFVRRLSFRRRSMNCRIRSTNHSTARRTRLRSVAEAGGGGNCCMCLQPVSNVLRVPSRSARPWATAAAAVANCCLSSCSSRNCGAYIAQATKSMACWASGVGMVGASTMMCGDHLRRRLSALERANWNPTAAATAATPPAGSLP